jgi:hypothetical protein
MPRYPIRLGWDARGKVWLLDGWLGLHHEKDAHGGPADP